MADIKVHPRCNKVWGEPYPCEFCEALFPSILSKAKGGKRPRAMPDGRVTKIVKQMMVMLAELKPHIISVEEAKGFSVRCLRSGGTTEAAGQGVREGVLQGHGGWAVRESLIHYDLMQEGEKTTGLGNKLHHCGAVDCTTTAP